MVWYALDSLRRTYKIDQMQIEKDVYPWDKISDSWRYETLVFYFDLVDEDCKNYK